MRARLISVQLTEQVAEVTVPDASWADREGSLVVEALLPAAADLAPSETPDWFVLQREDGRRLKVRLEGRQLAEGAAVPFTALAPRVRATRREGELLHGGTARRACPVVVDLWAYPGWEGRWRGTLRPTGEVGADDLLGQSLVWLLRLGAEERPVRLERLRVTPSGQRFISFHQAGEGHGSRAG